MSTRDRVFLLILFGGFLTFVFEVRYEHRYVFADHWEGWIPIYYSGLACLACLLGMAKAKWARSVAATIFFLGLIVSVLGLYHHTKFDPAIFEKFLFPERTVYSTNNPQREKRAVSVDQPLAAPLGILGLASVGFVIASGLFRTSKSS